MTINRLSGVKTTCFFPLLTLLFLAASAGLRGAESSAQKTKEAGAVSASDFDGEPGDRISSESSFILIDWETDFNDAKARAFIEGKDIFLLFASTDTSVWGQRLDDEVLSNPLFGSELSESFVFLLLDFPVTYRFPEPEFQRNEKIRKSWNVSTFPTVFLADAKGRPYAVTGYRNITAAEYAAHVRELHKIREARDRKLAAFAAAKTGRERATLLAEALRTMDESLLSPHYSEEIRELRQLDPDDHTGLMSDMDFPLKISRLRGQVFQLVRGKKNYDGALAAVDQFVRKNKPANERLQKALFLKLPVYANNERRDHAAVVALMDAIIAVKPDTEFAKMAAEVRQRALLLLSRPPAKAIPSSRSGAKTGPASKANSKKENPANP
ncbi:MAG: thioredoxin family protein [Puniceicoccales bacterium]|jgi:hypothetical protein|nr:thioredoxin family protein [Puniceicoccales bacterium]